MLQEVEIPDSVRRIGDSAFSGCALLSDLSLGNGVAEIGAYAFANCGWLRHLYIPDSVTSIGDQAFRGCVQLRDVVISGSVTEIGNHVFYGCASLTIYSESTSAQDGWGIFWNSMYRPVLWGCTVSDDGYVVSYTKGAITNQDERKTVLPPSRDGYVFLGWTTTEGGTEAEYDASEIVDVPDGTTVYAVWAVDTETETPAEGSE